MMPNGVPELDEHWQRQRLTARLNDWNKLLLESGQIPLNHFAEIWYSIKITHFVHEYPDTNANHTNTCHMIFKYSEGILPKGPYLPCVSMAVRALLAGYHRYVINVSLQSFQICFHSCTCPWSFEIRDDLIHVFIYSLRMIVHWDTTLKYIEVWRDWPPICRRNFHIYFLEYKFH